MPAERGRSLYSASTIVPIEKRLSSMSIAKHDNPEYAINRISHKYDSYQNLHYDRRRLSSTGDGSGDSSTTTSGSSCGEREDGSEGRAESEEAEREEQDERLPLEGQVTETERQQVEAFFKGFKTQIFVSGSLANLYTKKQHESDWTLKFTGIPLVLLDMGEARSRDRRQIQIVLAERGTCFMLWRDTIDNLTSYRVEGKAFHTMSYSANHSLKIGFSFDTAQAAHDMWTHIERLVSCPENISLSVPGKKKKKKEKKPPKPAPLPPKSHISQPCCFQHVTSVEQEDKMRYYSLKEYVLNAGNRPAIQGNF